MIIGGGPAGLSAATVLGRCLRTVVLYDAGKPRNDWSKAVHGFLSRDGVHPRELLERARTDLSRYHTVERRNGSALEARKITGGFEVTTSDGAVRRSRKLLLATGVRDILPEIEGIEELYGRSVHHCPYCDGWEHRGEVIAVYGFDGKGEGLARLLAQWSEDVVLCTGGAPADPKHVLEMAGPGVKIRAERILRLEGWDGRLQRIVFESGPSLECQAFFFNTGQYQRSPLLEQLGCTFHSNGGVITNEREETAVPGLYVAGDASRDFQFVMVAAAEGMKAAVAINAALVNEAAR